MFYVKDWLSDFNVRLLSPSQKGFYIDILCHMWNAGGKLTKDKKILKRVIVGLRDSDLKALEPMLIVGDKYYTQKRMTQELENLKEKRKRGKEAADIRWQHKGVPEKKSDKSESRKVRRERVAGELREELNKIYQKDKKKYPQEMYKRFFDYWSIPQNVKDPVKCVFEKEKSWNLERRLQGWHENDKLRKGEVVDNGVHPLKGIKVKPVNMDE